MKRLASIKHFSLAPCLLVTAGCTTSLDLPKTASGVVQTSGQTVDDVVNAVLGHVELLPVS